MKLSLLALNTGLGLLLGLIVCLVVSTVLALVCSLTGWSLWLVQGVVFGFLIVILLVALWLKR